MKSIEVVAGIIIRDGRVYATQRGYGKFKDMWEFPGGKLELGETPQEALVRELREELDIAIVAKDEFMVIDYDYPDFHITLHCVYADIVSGEPKLLEHENAVWADKDTLERLNFLPADKELISKLIQSKF